MCPQGQKYTIVPHYISPPLRGVVAGLGVESAGWASPSSTSAASPSQGHRLLAPTMTQDCSAAVFSCLPSQMNTFLSFCQLFDSFPVPSLPVRVSVVTSCSYRSMTGRVPQNHKVSALMESLKNDATGPGKKLAGSQVHTCL